MSGGPSAGPQPDGPKGQVHLVVDYHQVGGLDAEAGQQVMDGFAAVVHVGSGLGQNHRCARHFPLPQDGMLTAVGKGNAPTLSELVDTGEAHVVTGPGVAGAGIAQTDDDFQSGPFRRRVEGGEWRFGVGVFSRGSHSYILTPMREDNQDV